MENIQNLKSKTPNFGAPLDPWGGTAQKSCTKSKVPIFFLGDLFFEKMLNSKSLFFQPVPTHLDPNISGLTPKFIIRLPKFSSPRSKVSSKVCHVPVGKKLRGR